MNAAALYFGEVVHERKRPRLHQLRYNVFSMLLDVDQLDAISAKNKFFSYNRWGLFSLYDKDHGNPGLKHGSIAQWVRSKLKEAGLAAGSHRIDLLCYPRILGYVFNPLSVYFCYSEIGNLCTIIYEVHNTFGERHAYVIKVDDNARSIIRQEGDKEFFVSPFIPMDCQYKFRIQPPDDDVRVAMRVEDKDGLLLTASFSACRKPFDDRNLMLAFLRFPLMTIKVIMGIHWEALKLWRKNVPYLGYTPSPKQEISKNIKQEG
jgi:hypothetical protein